MRGRNRHYSPAVPPSRQIFLSRTKCCFLSVTRHNPGRSNTICDCHPTDCHCSPTPLLHPSDAQERFSGAEVPRTPGCHFVSNFAPATTLGSKCAFQQTSPLPPGAHLQNTFPKQGYRSKWCFGNSRQIVFPKDQSMGPPAMDPRARLPANPQNKCPNP